MVEGTSTRKSTLEKLVGTDLTLTDEIGGPDPALDHRARADYRRQMKELEAERDEADRFNDIGRAARAREELDCLNSEVASGIGIDGHPRQGVGHAERARVMVGRNIRAALDKIRRGSPALGRHFAISISTGYFCSYQPKAEHLVPWQIGTD